jgi:uncharacterized protein with HEPN domain
MKPLERDAAYLWDTLDAAKQAAELSAGIGLDQLLDDVRTRYAVERALEIVGEAARRVSQETRQAHPEIPWSGIIGFRNVLAHEYGDIDYRRLYTVLKESVPDLVMALENILDLLEKE